MPSTPPLKRLRSSEEESEEIYINRIENDGDDDENDVDETLAPPATSLPSNSSEESNTGTNLTGPSFAQDLSDVRGCLQVGQNLAALRTHK